MAVGEIAGAARPTRLLTLVTLTAWAILAFALPLAALTLNTIKFANFPVGYWLTSFWCMLLLAVLALMFQRRAGGDRGVGGSAKSLAFAGEAMGAAGVLGFAAAIAELGYDGLAYPLGLVAGLALMAILVAPRFALYPVHSLPGFLSARFGGVWPARLALLAALPATIWLLAANLRGAALATQGLIGWDYGTSLALATAGLTAFWLASAFLGERKPLGAAFGLALLALLLLFVSIAVNLGRPPFAGLVSGSGLVDLSALDQKLITGKLADFKSLRPMMSPFLQMPMSSFAGIVLSLALGFAACPQMLGRHVSRATVTAGEASRRTALATLFAALFLVIVPALAGLQRLAVETAIGGGIKTAELPQNIADAAALGWLKVCGASSSIQDACAQIPGHRGVLRLQDIAFTSDGSALASARISNVSDFVVLPFELAVLALSWMAARALLAGYFVADDMNRRAAQAVGQSLDAKQIVRAALLLLAGLMVAMLGQKQIAELTAEGFALFASALFPALVLGLYWRKMSAAGAVAAIATGFTIAFFYIAGVTLGAVPSFGWTGLQNAAISLVAVPAGFFAGLVASLVSKAPSNSG